MKGRFLAVWGLGYGEKPVSEKYHEVDADFITEENGYREENIKTIEQLEIGESINLPECGFHSIVRLR